MSKTLISGIVSLILTLSLSMASCSAVSSIQSDLSSPPIPSTNYPVDLIGHVTFANNVIRNGQDYSPGSGSVYWIIQVFARNKSSQSPITSNSLWGCVNENNPTIFGVLVLYIQPSSVSITEGETGKLTFLCTAVDAATPNQYQISLNTSPMSSTSPMSYGNLINTNTTDEIYNWDLQIATGLASSNPTTPLPSGTYTGTIIGNIQQSVSFQSNNTLVVNNNVEGKTIYKYSISGQTITETNIVTNQTGTESYQFIPSDNLVVLGGISYYK
jgi:hypothetical protein